MAGTRLNDWLRGCSGEALRGLSTATKSHYSRKNIKFATLGECVEYRSNGDERQLRPTHSQGDDEAVAGLPISRYYGRDPCRVVVVVLVVVVCANLLCTEEFAKRAHSSTTSNNSIINTPREPCDLIAHGLLVNRPAMIVGGRVYCE